MTPAAEGSTSSVQPEAASRASVAEIDDLELKACLRGDAGAERFAVLGGPAGLGRDEPGPRHAARPHLVATDQKRVDRPPDRGFADAAGFGDPLAEPDNTGKRIDDVEPVGRRPGDEQTAIVGTEIEGRIRRVDGPVDAQTRVIAIKSVATDAVRGSTRPTGPPTRYPMGVEAAPWGLLVHPKAILPRRSLRLDGGGPCPKLQIRQNVSATGARAILCRPCL